MNTESREEICKGVLSRYDLSFFSYRQLQRDHIRFEQEYTEKFPNDFICRILINYMSYAQNHFRDKFEQDMLSYLSEKSDNEYYISEFRLTFTKDLVNKIYEFDFALKGSIKKRRIINFILEQFTSLSFSEREMVYFYSHYENINKALEDSTMLLITHSEGQEFEVKPYCLKIDDNSYSYYLVGYSRERGSDNEFEIHPIKLNRIRKCKLSHKEFVLTYKNKSTAKKLLEKFGSAYIVSDLDEKNIKPIVVRLTEYGYKQLFLKFITHQRPIPISQPEQIVIDDNRYYDLRFECSEGQIHNYFFSFGKDAKIIDPELLRNKFLEKFQAAVEHYKK